MHLSWEDVALGWPVTLADFVGTQQAMLPDFDPFDRLCGEYRNFSLDPFAALNVSDDGLRLHLLKSTLAPNRLTAVLVDGHQRVGYVARRPEGCDVVSLAAHLRSRGLAAPLLLGARRLRARLQ